MKKLLLFSFAVCLITISGFANNKIKNYKNQKKQTISLNHTRLIKVRPNKEGLISLTEHHGNTFTCYNFGYERQCMDPGSCMDYTLCGDNFSDVWDAHLAQDELLYDRDCGVPIYFVP